MKTITIKNRWNGSVIHEGEYESVFAAMADALKIGKNLRDADLSGANLSDADLSGANLSDANLSDAHLRDANLSDANLSDADLSGANLSDADLSDAHLRDADLRGANLSGANLRGANLSDADLSGANLSGANLRGADLSGANLSDANLSGAHLSGANLEPVRVDFIAEVLKLPNELEFLRSAIMDGKIDGSTYSGECACLAGTMAHAKGIENYHGGEIKNGMIFKSNSSSPRELFFLAINRGDTPENNGAAALALQWTEEAIAMRNNIRATANIGK